MLTQRGVVQRVAQAQPAVDAAGLVGGDAQVAKAVLRRLAHTDQEDAAAIQRHRGHVVLVFTRLAGAVAQAVGDGRADVVQQLVLGHLVARAQARGDGVHQIDLAHIGRAGALTGIGGAQVLDIDDPQRGELQRHLLLALGALRDQFGLAADGAFDLESLALAQRQAAQLHPRAAVVKAALVQGHAVVEHRLVDLHAVLGGLAGAVVVDGDLAGKQFGHAGGVVLDDELLQLHVKGQVLQHHAVGHAEHGHTGARALGHEEVAAEGGVVD